MIRPTKSDDIDALLALAVAAVGFSPEELKELQVSLTDCLSDENSHDFWLTDDDDCPVAAAYCAPERMTNGTWNLLFIAVHPDYQGQGRGTALISHIEQRLTAQGAHLLLVETLASFERTRAFYRKYGFNEEARIRDFYDVGADKIVYRKVLAA